MIRIDHFHHFESAPGVDAKLDELLDLLKSQGESMSAALDRLKVEVAETRTAVDSAVTLIGGLSQQIRDLKDDPAALQALADDLDAQQADIANAVTANTDPNAPQP